MGFLDKAKEAANQAMASAQQVAQQGQAKVAAYQQSTSANELYRALGEAFYAEQRSGGSTDGVVAALAALDAHWAAVAQAQAAAAEQAAAQARATQQYGAVPSANPSVNPAAAPTADPSVPPAYATAPTYPTAPPTAPPAFPATPTYPTAPAGDAPPATPSVSLSPPLPPAEEE